jgi:hypothetical protein
MSDERTAQTWFRRDPLGILLVEQAWMRQMTKCWLIPFFMAGLLGDQAFADCLPAHDTPASVIEYFQKFNKPLPERFCAKDAPPQASHEPPQDFSQTQKAPDQYGEDDGPADGPFSQYEGDPEGAYERDLGGGYERDQDGVYERDQRGGYEWDQGRGYERHQPNDYEWDQGGDYERDQGDTYQDAWDYDSGGYWKHRKGHGKYGKRHGKRKAACKKAHMKWNKSTKTCSKGS